STKRSRSAMPAKSSPTIGRTKTSKRASRSRSGAASTGPRGAERAEHAGNNCLPGRNAYSAPCKLCAHPVAVDVDNEAGEHQGNPEKLQRRERLAEEQRAAREPGNGNQQRERRHQRGRIAMQQPRPRREAEQR